VVVAVVVVVVVDVVVGIAAVVWRAGNRSSLVACQADMLWTIDDASAGCRGGADEPEFTNRPMTNAVMVTQASSVSAATRPRRANVASNVVVPLPKDDRLWGFHTPQEEVQLALRRELHEISRSRS
jgi:hypothetical protein